MLIALTFVMSACCLFAFAGCIVYEDCMHEWQNTVVQTQPTCTQTGLQGQKCTICGEKKTIEIPVLGHDFAQAWSSDENGHYHVCTRDNCTEKQDEATHVDENSDHACDVCESVFSVCIDENTDGKCDICGKDMCNCVDNDKNHYCDICGKKLSEHSGGTATCTQKATCDVCGDEYGDALGHNSEGSVAHKDADCINAGVVGGSYCTRCNEGKAAAEATIDALGHNGEGSVAHKDADCTNAGVVGGSYCTRCNEGKAAAEATIDALGHNSEGSVAHKDADCINAGVVGGSYCTRCNEGKAAAEATIDALGHNGEGSVAHKDADCINAGVVGGTYCTRCNEGKDAAEAIIPVSHNMYDGFDGEEHNGATYTDTYCLNCDYRAFVKLLTFTLENDSYIVTGVSSQNITEATIPATYMGKPVTEIRGAFKSCKQLTAVSFENGSNLATIGEKAFMSCTALKSITTPASVTTIGNNAFQNCTGLQTITFGGETKIASDAFQGVGSNLTSLVIGASGDNLYTFLDYVGSGFTAMADATAQNPVTVTFTNATKEQVKIATQAQLNSSAWYMSLITGGNCENFHINCTDGELVVYHEAVIPADCQHSGNKAYVEDIKTNTYNFYINLPEPEEGGYWAQYEGNNVAITGAHCYVFNEAMYTDDYYTDEKGNRYHYYADLDCFIIYVKCSLCDKSCGYFGSSSKTYDEQASKAATCTEEGKNVYLLTFEKVAASNVEFDPEFVNDSTNNWIDANTIDGKVTITFIVAPIEHTYDKEVATQAYFACEATCSLPAEYYYSCICGKTSKDTVYENTFYFGDALGHNTDGAAFVFDDDNHWQLCKTCNGIVNKAAHDYNSETHLCVCGEFDPAVVVATEGLEFAYDEKTQTYTVTGYTGTATEVIIPETYNDDINGKKAVVAIGENAFLNKTAVTSIVVPDTVTSIANGAFSGCSSLQSITLPFVGAKAKTEQTEYQYPLGYIFGENEYEGSVLVAQSYKMPSATLSTRTNYYIPETLQSVTITGGEIGYGAFYKCNKLISVTLSEGITSIGQYVFYSCSSLQSVVIPDSVTSIGNNAFYVCTKLTYVKLPSKLTYIGRSAFGYCSELASVVIPNTVTTVETYAFTDCKKLVNVTFPGGVTSIGESVFENCPSINYNVYENACYVGNEQDPYIILVKAVDTSITECVIHSGTKVISAYAFKNCTSLTDVTVPDGVICIGQQAFYNCSGLAKIVIPDSVTTINDKAFSSSGLQSITLGIGIIEVLDDAFSNCSSLTRVDITDLSAYLKISFNRNSSNPLYYAKNIYLNGELLTDLVIPEDITEIKKMAFSNATCLKTITIHSGVTKIANAFESCAQLTGIYISDISAWMNIDFEGTQPLNYAKNLYLNNVLLTELTVPDTFTEIKANVFFGADCLEKVIIPEGVTAIGSDAFRHCDNLESISIPNSLTSVGSGAFYYCNKLKNNSYDNAYYLGNENNPYLLLLDATNTSITSCEIHKDTKFIYSEAFRGAKITSLTIPESVTTIGSYAFAYSSITSIVIPDTVTNLDEAMFINCSNLQSVTLSNKITEIGGNFFSGCSSLTSVVIPDSVTEIDIYAFRNCTKLESVTIGKNVTKIRSNAFYGCTALKSVVIPDSVTTIYDEAFGNCTELTSITFGNGLTSISAYAFEGCSKLTEIVIPESYTNIGFRAFAKCTGLTTVTIHAGVTEFDTYMFESCESLTTINYKGTVEQWKKIVKSSYWKSSTGEFTVICTDGTIAKADA